MNPDLKDLLDDFLIAYLDLLIYSKNYEKHVEFVQKLLQNIEPGRVVWVERCGMVRYSTILACTKNYLENFQGTVCYRYVVFFFLIKVIWATFDRTHI